MKFHAIAIGAISVLVILLYAVMGPSSEEQHAVRQPSDRFARISSATWGQSCNQQIAEARQQQDAIPLGKDADGKIIQSTPMKTVTADNVLDTVKKTCEGQLNCEIVASDDALGVRLPPGCYKQLNVNYQCSDVDRLQVVTIEQGQMLKIDCVPNASAPAATPKP